MPVAKAVKKESSSSDEDEDDSSEESSDDEPSQVQQAKKVHLVLFIHFFNLFLTWHHLVPNI